MARKADTTLVNMNGTIYISLPAKIRQDSQFNKKILEKDAQIEIYGDGVKIRQKEDG